MIASVLISYSAADSARYHRLLLQLKLLETASDIPIEVWDEARVDGSVEWDDRMREAVRRAAVVICLTSPDYLGSKLVMQEEIPYLLQRREQEGMALLPVAVRHCSWKLHRWLEALSVLLPGAREGRVVADFPDPDALFAECHLEEAGRGLADVEAMKTVKALIKP
jgi:hypothetical protein